MHSFSTAAAMLCVVLAGGCGGVKGPDIVGTWNSKLKNPSSGIEVTIEMVVKANKTFTITYVASEIGRNDKQTGTWRAKTMTQSNSKSKKVVPRSARPRNSCRRTRWNSTMELSR